MISWTDIFTHDIHIIKSNLNIYLYKPYSKEKRKYNTYFKKKKKKKDETSKRRKYLTRKRKQNSNWAISIEKKSSFELYSLIDLSTKQQNVTTY